MASPAPKWLTIALVFLVSAGTLQTEASPLTLAPRQGGSETLKAAAYPKYFGAAIAASYLTNYSNDPRFVQTAAAQFSGLTPENEMKWQYIEPEPYYFNFTGGDIIVAFGQALNYTIRGHNLVWYQELAPWVMNLTGDVLLNATTNHITTVLNHYANQLYCFDVVNEAFNDDGTYRDNIWYQNFGPEYLEIVYRTARSVNSGIKLYINDYNTEGINAKSDALLSLVQNLTAQGLIDGVGFESHFEVGQVPSDFQANMQRFIDAGVEVAITELDIRMSTPASQANITQQASDYAYVASVCEALERCVGMTTWGITDLYSWVPSTFPGEGYALLFDDNYNPTPAFYSTVDALNG